MAVNTPSGLHGPHKALEVLVGPTQTKFQQVPRYSGIVKNSKNAKYPHLLLLPYPSTRNLINHTSKTLSIAPLIRLNYLNPFLLARLSTDSLIRYWASARSGAIKARDFGFVEVSLKRRYRSWASRRCLLLDAFLPSRIQGNLLAKDSAVHLGFCNTKKIARSKKCVALNDAWQRSRRASNYVSVTRWSFASLYWRVNFRWWLLRYARPLTTSLFS